MTIVHRVTGYDKKTEVIAQEFDVPVDRLAELRELANVNSRVVEIVGAYPLDRSSAQIVKDRFQFGMWIDRCDWFFEPFAL